MAKGSGGVGRGAAVGGGSATAPSAPAVSVQITGGSPKQIQYATALRDRLISQLTSSIASSERQAAMVADGSRLRTWAERTKAIRDAARTIPEARFWLDNQRDPVSAVARRFKLPDAYEE